MPQFLETSFTQRDFYTGVTRLKHRRFTMESTGNALRVVKPVPAMHEAALVPMEEVEE